MAAQVLQILLADDDQDDCLFKEALSEIPFQTHLITVHDGEQLINYFNTDSNPIPQVLFLDLNMPRKNGFDCLLEIKRIERLKHIPVIIFSTSMEQKIVHLLYKNGAHFYIHKPSEFFQLKKLIFIAITRIHEGIYGEQVSEISVDQKVDDTFHSQHPAATGRSRYLSQPSKELFVLSS